MTLVPTAAPDEIAQPLDRLASRLGLFAGRITWYPEISSTNDVAAGLAERGAPEGLVIAADMQMAGRGRLGRSWSSPPGAGIYASVILRPPAHAAALLTIAAGVALVEGIRAATGLDADLKWPNDVYVAGRKLAGILAEASSSAGGIQHVVVGFGINVLPAAFPPDVAARATSLEGELGRAVDRGLVFAECLAALSARYQDVCERRSDAVLAAWRARAVSTFGRPVEWDVAGQTQRGIAEAIDDSGALLVRGTSGVSRVIAGEMRWS